MCADLHEIPQEQQETAGRSLSGFADFQSPIVRLFIIFALFTCFVAAAYALFRPGLDAVMIYDARGWIENKAHIFGQHNLREVISIVPARPLFMLTLYINYLWSGMDPAAFRITNLLIVAATGVSFVLLYLSVLGASSGLPEKDKLPAYGVSLFLGLVFAIHPLQTFTILYIWQREAILACFFYFSGLAVYIASRSGQLEKGASGYVLTAIFFLAGLMSKENVVTLPIVLVLVELIFFPQDRKEIFRNIGRIALFTVPAFALYVLVTLYAQGTESVHASSIGKRLAEYYEDAGITPLSVILTESRVLFSYLRMILAPTGAGFPMLRAEIVSMSIADPPATACAVAGIAGLIALGVALARRRPRVSFGILFFLVSSAPEALLLPQYLFCGYRAILPMAGVLIALGDLLLAVLPLLRSRTSSRAFVSASVAVALVLLVYLSTVTVSQARNWNPLSFWSHAYRHLPAFSDRVAYRPYSDILTNYGLELVATGDYSKAIAVLKQAMDIELSAKPTGKTASISSHGSEDSGASDDARANLRVRGTRGSKVAALINLGKALQKSGNVTEARACFEKAVDISPRSAIAHSALAGALKEAGDVDKSVQEYRQAIALDPDFAPAYNELGLAVEESGNLAEAIGLYRKALEHSPGFAEAHNNLGTALEKAGKLTEALDEYQQAIACNPRLAQAYSNVGILLLRFGKVGESIAHHQAAIRLDPSSALAYSNLGAALEASGNLAAALGSYRKAVELKPDLPEANYALANALLKSGKTDEAVTYFRKTVALSPKFMEAYANLGLALLSTGRLPEAIESLRQAVAVGGNVPGLHNALGVALAQSGKRSEAIEHFTKAVQLDPNDARARQNLQRILGGTDARPENAR